jgi:hypothetical protein
MSTDLYGRILYAYVGVKKFSTLAGDFHKLYEIT